MLVQCYTTRGDRALPPSAFQALGVRPGLRGLQEEEGGVSFLKQLHAPRTSRLLAARSPLILLLRSQSSSS